MDYDIYKEKNIKRKNNNLASLRIKCGFSREFTDTMSFQYSCQIFF